MIYAIVAIVLMGLIMAFRTFGLLKLKSETDKATGNITQARFRSIMWIAIFPSILLLEIGVNANIAFIKYVGFATLFSALVVVIVGGIHVGRSQRK